MKVTVFIGRSISGQADYVAAYIIIAILVQII